MTREEQIIEAVKNPYLGHSMAACVYERAFLEGAKWADENPVNEEGETL